MSEEQTDPGGTAVKALAAAAATGAATYAVRKALESRNGHDDSEQGGDEEETSERDAPEDSAEAEEEDYSEDAEDEDEEDEEEDLEPGDSAEEDEDEDDELDDDDQEEESMSNGSGSSSGKGSLRRLANPSRLASVSHLLVPLAGEAADSAGRYVAEHAPDPVRKIVVPRFIDAFEKAS